MVKITVEQMDGFGNPYRTFTFWRKPDQVADQLDRITMGFNMYATRVTISDDVR